MGERGIVFSAVSNKLDPFCVCRIGPCVLFVKLVGLVLMVLFKVTFKVSFKSEGGGVGNIRAYKKSKQKRW